MAEVRRPRPLQLLRGTREPREPGDVPGPDACDVVAHSSPPQSETPAHVDAHPRVSSAMASSTEYTPSVSRCALCRQLSAIRTGCANERPSGSVEGVMSNHDPYSDRQLIGFTAHFHCDAGHERQDPTVDCHHRLRLLPSWKRRVYRGKRLFPN